MDEVHGEGGAETAHPCRSGGGTLVGAELLRLALQEAAQVREVGLAGGDRVADVPQRALGASVDVGQPVSSASFLAGVE